MLYLVSLIYLLFLFQYHTILITIGFLKSLEIRQFQSSTDIVIFLKDVLTILGPLNFQQILDSVNFHFIKSSSFPLPRGFLWELQLIYRKYRDNDNLTLLRLLTQGIVVHLFRFFLIFSGLVHRFSVQVLHIFCQIYPQVFNIFVLLKITLIINLNLWLFIVDIQEYN